MDNSKKSLFKPHDKFFKQIFSDLNHTKSFLEGVLPKKISKKVDFDSLRLDNNSYINEELKETFSDLVFEVSAGKETINLAFLLEHKSYVSENIYHQLLGYMLKIWPNSSNNNRLVIPIVLYHGTEQWQQRSFEEYFGKNLDPIFLSFVPSFQYILVNLQIETPNSIQQ